MGPIRKELSAHFPTQERTGALVCQKTLCNVISGIMVSHEFGCMVKEEDKVDPNLFMHRNDDYKGSVKKIS